MPIIPEKPITIPEKTLDKFWVRNITIEAPKPNGEARAIVDLLPYNEDGDVDYSEVKVFKIENIMSKIMKDQSSDLAKAMHFLLASIDIEYKSSQTEQDYEPQGD